MQKPVMLPRTNSCSRDFECSDTTMAAALSSSAFLHSTLPMLSVSTSACASQQRNMNSLQHCQLRVAQINY